jgi:hypothetical protein
MYDPSILSMEFTYCGIFKELGHIFKGYDLSIIPIGAYLPR